MTRKRFKLIDIGFVYDDDKLIGMKEIVDLLNSLNNENEELKKQREELFYRERDIKNEWRTLREENEQLRERNNNQHKQLNQLWQLIEAKDWETLAMDYKIKVDEERLTQKWGHYELIEKRCTDCKHTKGIGYDFWCDEGHTEYEVFGGETNCPYFEYHDWSKGTPSETEKPFCVKKNIFDGYSIFNNHSGRYYAYDKQDLKKLCETLNDLYKKNKELGKENKRLRDCLIEIYTISKNESVE